MKNRSILLGDVMNKIKEIPDESIDLICTDPPYGYSFMNKDWDKVVISSNVWKECLRVLKPGSFAFIMSAPRQDVLCRVMINLEKAGFVMGFTSIYWAYASGFPKAMNVSKAVDKKLGVIREIIGYEKNIGHIERGDKNINEQISQHGDSIFTGDKAKTPITKSISPQAKKLDGSYAGFQPKPALEVILVCMKPLSEKNYVEQALSNSKGVTWLDDCRIPYKNQDDKWVAKNAVIDNSITGNEMGLYSNSYIGKNEKDITRYDAVGNNQGRFPANLIVSDNALDTGEKTKSKGHVPKKTNGPVNVYGKYGEFIDVERWLDDEGDFSRYYSLDSWEAQFLVTPKPSKSEKNEGLKQYLYKTDQYEGKYPKSQVIGKQVNDDRIKLTDNLYQRENKIKQNIHPTVKPVELFKYLISMGSRPNDFVLDPFMGSGTTAIACEKLARNWIGIEINEKYCEIINARIENYKKQVRLFD